MKLATAPQNVTVHGNFKTSDFNVGDVAFIVDMFADKVYTHKERAVIRELSCNAHDSHIMAGTKDVPFNVHLPTSLEPWFSVRDFGTGLSDDDVRNIFAGIGISTKRNSNEVIGCFGIGSLSPYSLADSFTVVSYHNGMMRTYTCYRDEQRKPVVALLAEETTSQANGLEVSVSVNGRFGTFEEEAMHVFRFWEGTLPNINNASVSKRCQEERENFTFKGEDFGLSPSYGDIYAVMGNIAYKVPYELDEFRCNGYIKFNLGELEFDTARENLSMTDKVRNAIKSKFRSIKSKLSQIAIERIESQQTDYDKAVLADKISQGSLGNLLRGVDFKKYALPETKEPFEYWQTKYRGSDKNRSKFVPVGKNVEYYVHKDRMSTRIKSYLKDRPSGYTLVIFKDYAQAMECKIPSSLLLDLDDLPKLERTSSGSNTSKVKTFMFVKSYNYKPENCWKELTLEIGKKEIVYVEISRWQPMNNGIISGTNRTIESTLETLEECGINRPVVVGLKTAFLTTKQFKNGNFITLDDYVRREFAKIAPTSYYEYDNNKMNVLRAINKCIEHDDVKSIVGLADSCKNSIVADVCKRLKIISEVSVDNSIQDLMTEFFDKYKMFKFIDCFEIARDTEIIAEYISGKVK